MIIAEGLTDIGRARSQNQDAFFISTVPVGPLPNLFLVADGMGGHNAGDVASTKAAAFFCDYVKNYSQREGVSQMDLLVEAASDANRRVLEIAESDPSLAGMGTTLTACTALDNGKCEFIHVGDSRAYMVNDGKITQITLDHTFVGEMVKAGQLTPEQARTHPKRNILTRVLGGVSPILLADGFVREIPLGGYVLLCSDGLTSELDDEAIKGVVLSKRGLREKARTLVKLANESGGADNITVVLIRHMEKRNVE
ncbi:MAG: Stp1/IreP family PP2C-type Ser/Thr phosphatase [Defluviitaleaceae bacterium]|nr:Stp1/IreP family PP2C-type Ser/Thr phosphatase [Defluviitaleaceae bacterium]